MAKRERKQSDIQYLESLFLEYANEDKNDDTASVFVETVITEAAIFRGSVADRRNDVFKQYAGQVALELLAKISEEVKPQIRIECVMVMRVHTLPKTKKKLWDYAIRGLLVVIGDDVFFSMSRALLKATKVTEDEKRALYTSLKEHLDKLEPDKAWRFGEALKRRPAVSDPTVMRGMLLAYAHYVEPCQIDQLLPRVQS